MAFTQRNCFYKKEPYMAKDPNPKGIDLAPLDLDKTAARFKSSLIEISEYSMLAQKQDVKPNTKENLYRSQIIMIVSSFDSFLHELAKVVVLCMYNGQWNRKTDAYTEIEEALKSSRGLLDKSKLIEETHERIKTHTYYNISKKPEEGIEYCLFSLMGLNREHVIINSNLINGVTSDYEFKKRIRTIAGRRNSIAHNYDRDNSSLDKTVIDKSVAEKAVSDIKKIVDSILKEVDFNILKIQQTA